MTEIESAARKLSEGYVLAAGIYNGGSRGGKRQLRTYTNKQRVRNFLTSFLTSFGVITGTLILCLVMKEQIFLNIAAGLSVISLGLCIFFGAWRFGSGVGAGLITGLFCCGLSGFALCTAGVFGSFGAGMH
jgi:hypothetical protein